MRQCDSRARRYLYLQQVSKVNCLISGFGCIMPSWLILNSHSVSYNNVWSSSLHILRGHMLYFSKYSNILSLKIVFVNLDHLYLSKQCRPWFHLCIHCYSLYLFKSFWPRKVNHLKPVTEWKHFLTFQLIHAHAGPVIAVSVSPDGKFLVSFSHLEQKIKFWQVNEF